LVTENEELELVEESASTKMEKKTVDRGAGKLEAPVSRARVNENRMNVKSAGDTTLDHGISRDEQS
jgi:hypothetical protein